MIKINTVSVIIPCYNSEKYIKKCLESLQKQTYKKLEIIVIDDGSKDETPKIVTKMSKKDSRIKLFIITNRGVSYARNYGLLKSSGEFITFVDSDDWVSPNFIEHAMIHVEKYDLDIISGGTEKKYFNKSEKFVINSEKIKIYHGKKLKDIENKIIGYNSKNVPELDKCFMSGSVCKIFKKTIIKDIKFDEQIKIGEDTIYNIEALRNSRMIGIVPEIWYYYRMNEESATKKINPNINEQLKKTMIKLEKLNIEKEFCDKRIISSINGIFELFPFHKDAKLSLWKKRKIVKNILGEEYWSKRIKRIDYNEFENIKYKMLLLLVKNKLYTILTILYEIKKIIISKRKKV